MLLELFEEYRKLSTNKSAGGMSFGAYNSLKTYVTKYEQETDEYSYTTFLHWLNEKDLATNTKAFIANSLGKFLWINSVISQEEFAKLKSSFRQETTSWSGQHVSNDTIKLMLDATHSPTNDFASARDKFLIMTLAITGLRVSEITAINRLDLILNNNLIVYTVYQKKSNGGDKTKQKRTIKINDSIKIFDISYKVVIQKYLQLCDELFPNAIPLFISAARKRMAIRTVQFIVAKLATIAGVKVTPHTFRHEALTRATNKFGLHTGAVMGGHTSLSTTMKYVNPKHVDIRDAYDNYEQGAYDDDDDS